MDNWFTILSNRIIMHGYHYTENHPHTYARPKTVRTPSTFRNM